MSGAPGWRSFLWRTVLVLVGLTWAQSWACDRPFSVFQNGPDAVVALRMRIARDEKLAPPDQALLTRYEADESAYWSLRVKFDPVCGNHADPHDCVSQCKNRPAAVVKQARFREDDLYYSLPPKERAVLEADAAALEARWNTMPFVK